MNPNFNWLQSTSESPIFMVLVACSVLTLAVALERAYYYWKRRGDPDLIHAQISERLRAGDTAQARWQCRQTAHPMGRAALQVLESQGLDDAVVEEKLLIALSQERLLLERNIGILGTMAATAPLIGLLGTVWGIMRAFRDMSLAGSAAPTVVAGGVAEALITTAAGLAVAIPSAFLYNHFARRMSVMLTLAENHARGLHTVLSGGSRSTSNVEDGEIARAA